MNLFYRLNTTFLFAAAVDWTQLIASAVLYLIYICFCVLLIEGIFEVICHNLES